MDIPSVRFLFPLLVLAAFYWSLLWNPWMPNDLEYGAGLPPEAFQIVLDDSARFMATGDLDRAEKVLLQVHQEFPQNSTYMWHLAEFYRDTGRYLDEAKMWEQFMEYAPLPGMACPQIGLAWRNAGYWDQAAEKFKDCFKIEETSDTTLLMALTLEQDGDLSEAEDLYSRVLEAEPGYTDAIIGAARTRLKLGKLESARDLIFSNLPKFPNNPDALLVAGMVSADLGDAKTARAYLLRGRRLNPEDPDFEEQLLRLGVAP